MVSLPWTTLNKDLPRVLAIVGVAVLGGGWGLSAVAQSSSDSDIDSLLNRADSALHGKHTDESKKTEESDKSETKTGGKPAKHKRTRRAPVDDSEAVLPAAPAEPKPAEQAKPVSPLSQQSLDQVLALDVQAHEREKMAGIRWFITRVGAGVDRLGTGYQFTKDDDTFSVVKRTTLSGATAEMGTSFLITPLTQGWWTTRATALAGVGFFQGSPLVERTGVQNYEKNYLYQLFPVDANAGIEGEIAHRVAMLLTYGMGAEVLHQDGGGQTDTLTDFFYGDILGLTLTWHYDKDIDVYARIQRRGVSPSAKISGQVIAMGIGMPFRG